MAKNISNMIGLDIYLSSMSDNSYSEIERLIRFQSIPTTPLLSWEFFSEHRFNQLKELKRAQDIAKVKSLARLLNWENDINEIFDRNDFEAILVTDLHQKIVWVNDGFTEMTGYYKSDALNRTPVFLQGPKTSSEATSRFRKNLIADQPFKEIITNYRKNKDIYECEVHIFPLFNKEKTHFIALERQVG